MIVLYDSNCDKDGIDLLDYSDDCNDRNNDVLIVAVTIMDMIMKIIITLMVL